MLIAAAGPIAAQDIQYGPFTVRSAAPEIIELAGDIVPGSADAFDLVLQGAGGARALVINSRAGSVEDAVAIALKVHRAGLDTLIPPGAKCEGPCALIFLAGGARDAQGALGVRRFSSEEGSVNFGRIIDMLGDFDAPIGVTTAMYRTDPEDLYVFSDEELRDYGLTGEPVEIREDPEDFPIPSAEDDSAAAAPARERRLVIYAGLDFFGGDFAEVRVNRAQDCANRCLGSGGRCRAFTFNTETRASRGPNCFLKSERGLTDGNVVAISGEILESYDPDPLPVTIGVIDPKQGLIKDYDFPGGDLFNRAVAGVDSSLMCRLACIQEDRCRAFTFVKRNKSCWLKASTAGGRRASGMISGQKSFRRLTPDRIIPLR